jgi:arginyl-tRNA synthetase
MDDLERIYPEAAAKFKTDEAFKKRALEMTDLLQKGDPQLTTQWKHFVQVTRDTLQVQLDRLKIVFDTWYGESFYEHLMPQMVEKLKLAHHTQESDGALVIVLADEQSPNMPPLILIKSGGGYLYHTSDLATVEHRVDVLKASSVLNFAAASG